MAQDEMFDRDEQLDGMEDQEMEEGGIDRTDYRELDDQIE